MINFLEHPFTSGYFDNIIFEGPVKLLNRTGDEQNFHDVYLAVTENMMRFYQDKASFTTAR